MCAGVAMELAKRDEGNLIKCVIPDIPMVNSDVWVSQTDTDTSETTLWAR